ncbi:hypothetical protein [Luteolibacter sp. Populi]|uniref:hypothetical protein n=1 Tax=Luteolibacter sp. Populi TaxID=3230487 RepID=UPI003466ACD3
MKSRHLPVLAILGMPLALSISSGMGLGILAAVVIAPFHEEGRENLTLLHRDRVWFCYAFSGAIALPAIRYVML